MDDKIAARGMKNFVLVLFIAIAYCFTAYQTYDGYHIALGKLQAFSIALLCSGCLFFLAMALRARLNKGLGTGAVWGGILVATMVSLPGNFNAFYTGFIRGELVKEELEEKRNALDDVLSRSQTVLADKAFLSLATEIESLKGQLRSQIMNDGDPGLGVEAKKIIAKIEGKLGDSLTPLVAQNKGKEALVALAEKYDQNIDAKLEAKRITMVSNAKERKEAENENKQVYQAAISGIDESLSRLSVEKNSSSYQQSVFAIQEATKAYSRIGAKTAASLPTGYAFDYDKKMTLKSDKIGNIDFSLNSALNHTTHFAVWLSLFLALFIDLGVPFLVRVVQDSSRNEAIEKYRGAQAKNSPRVL